MGVIQGKADDGLNRVIRIGEDGNLYVEGVMPTGTNAVTADISPLLTGGIDDSNILRAAKVGADGSTQVRLNVTAETFYASMNVRETC